MLLDVSLKATYDTEVDTLYVYLPKDIANKPDKPAGVIQINESTIADVDGNGNIVGIEFLFYSKIRKKKNDSKRSN